MLPHDVLDLRVSGPSDLYTGRTPHRYLLPSQLVSIIGRPVTIDGIW